MAIELTPKSRVYIRLNCLQQLKSPQICVSLDSSDGKSEDNLISINNNINNNFARNECNWCQTMRQLVLSKEMAIHRLSEDRDDLKAKLTLINNANIQLQQRLQRRDGAQRLPTDEGHQDRDQLITLKERCDELEAINKHLRQHLNRLRHVFNEFQNSNESTSNETTNTTNNTSKTSDLSNTLVNENTITLTESHSNCNIRTDNISNNTTIDGNNSADQQISSETSKSSFDKWYNK